MVHAGSCIFEPFRALGLTAGETPFHIQARGNKHFITIALGHAFHIYSVDKLKLLFVSPTLPEPITCLISHQDDTYVASGSKVYVFHRARLQHSLFKDDYRINHLLIHGAHLIAISDDNIVRQWNLSTQKVESELQLNPDSCRIVTALHPHTYVDKILFGLRSGALQLYNIRTSMLLHEFSADASRGSVTCLVQSPVIDVVAIGYSSGTIVLHNLLYDVPLFSFQISSPILAISFETQSHIMATTSLNGEVILFDLSAKRIAHRQSISETAIHSLQFVQNKLLSASTDNSLRVFKLDANCLLHPQVSRSGPSANVTALLFYGQASDAHPPVALVGCQNGSLRLTSLVRDSHNMAFSTKLLRIMHVPCITQIEVQPLRRTDWASILTAHAHANYAIAWHFDRKCALAVLPSKDKSLVTSVAISACGHYAYLGCNSGHIDVFNLQSLQYRKTYELSSAISSLSVDHSNSHLIASTLKGQLSFFSLLNDKLLHQTTFPSSIARLVLHPEMDVLAVLLDDGSVHLYDIPSQNTMRIFQTYCRLLNAVFSPDGRWLVTCNMNETVKVFDIPTSMIIDEWRMPNHCWVRGMAFSPAGDFLATFHVDSKSVYLWSNRSLISDGGPRILKDVITMSWPLVYADKEDGDEEEEKEDGMVCDKKQELAILDGTNIKRRDISEETIQAIYASPDQLHELITLSGAPKSQWQNLLSLALIKARNKPKEAVRAPEKIPFFLPTSNGGKDFNFIAAQVDRGEEASRVLDFSGLQPNSEFSVYLEKERYDDALDILCKASPVQVDVELRTLPAWHDFALWKHFFQALYEVGRKKMHFELLQSFLNVFLKIHGEEISNNMDMFKMQLGALRDQQKCQWQRLDEQFGQTMCLIDYCRQASRRI